MSVVYSQATMKPKMNKLKRVIQQWDWLLMVAIAPAMLFPDVRWIGVLIAIPLMLLIQGFAWGTILPVTPLNPAILLLAIMVGVSTFVTPDLVGSLGKIVGLLFGMAVYFCVVRHVRTRQGWNGSLVLFILAGTGVAVLGLVGTNWVAKNTWLKAFTVNLPIHLTGLPGAEAGIHPNELAGALLWVIPIIGLTGLVLLSERDWFYQRTERSQLNLLKLWSWRIFLIITLLIGISALILSQARGGYLAIGITCLVLIIMISKWPRRRWAIGILAVFGTGGIILIQQIGWRTIQSELIGASRVNESSLSIDSLSMRQEIWLHAVWAIQDTPLTGMGMNVFRNALFTLYPTFTVPASYSIGHAHNELLQAALDLGLPGAVGFLALYIGAVGMLYRPIKSGGTWHLLGLGVLGGLIAHFLFGVTDAVALGAKPGFLFWWLLAMAYGLFDQSRLNKAALNG